jgi:hypothetical protein
MAVAHSDGEAASFEASFEIEHSEHPHSILGYRVFFGDDANMAKAHALDERFHDTIVCNRLMCFGRGRRWHLCQFLPRDFSTVGINVLFSDMVPPVEFVTGYGRLRLGSVGDLLGKQRRAWSALMVDTSGVLAQPLLLKASHTLAQILDVVCGHLKLSDLIPFGQNIQMR